MHGVDYVVIVVLSVMVLLGVACLMLPLAAKLSIPYSVLLALLGMVIGALAAASGGVVLPAPVSDVLGGVRDLGLTGHFFLYVFLPSLLFAAGLAVDVRRLMDDVAPVLILAIVAVVLCTVVVGASLHLVFAVPLAVALLLGAVIATTDPAAVIAIFRDIGVPRRLQILVEGESLFNDAAAIALFTVLLGVVAGGQVQGFGQGALDMAVDFVGGLLFGYLAARAVCALLHVVKDYPVAEVTLTLCLAYTVYIVGDVYLHISGVVATVTAALVIGSTGRTHLSADGWSRLQTLWQQIEFVASTLIFVLAATMIPDLLADLQWSDAAMLAVVVLAALLARAAVLYGLLPLLSAARLSQRVNGPHKAVILWGGLRGAVTLAMALSVIENPMIPNDQANLVAVLATGFVLFTLFVNAPTLRPLINLLGLNRLTPLEAALRHRTIAVANEAVRANLGAVAREFGVEGQGIESGDWSRTQFSKAVQDEGGTALDREDMQSIALITVAAREEELYLNAYGGRTISSRVTGRCLAQAGRLRDAAKTTGLCGYQQVADEILRPNRVFHLALTLYNRLGVARPLARLLADRFEVMLVMRATLQQLRDFTQGSIAPLFGAAIEGEVLAVLQTRHEGIDQAIRAFELQYPGYAQSLRTGYVDRAALRLEEAEYRRKRDEGLISQEVYRTLAQDMVRRREVIGARPVLDLGLEVTVMIKKVPLFGSLAHDQLKIIARLLQPRFVVPGEHIIRKGEQGDAMFFIAAGAVEVLNSDANARVVREAGEFFGEIAILYKTRRTAEVRSSGYCHLLVLYARDLNRLLRHHPGMRAEMERAAQARMGPAEVEGGG